MENLEEKYEQLKQMFQEAIEKNAKLDEEVEKYKYKVIPMFSIGQELFCVKVKEKEVVSLKVDEITINKFGIAYREYISENEFKQFPETLCFANKIEANENMVKATEKN